MPSEVASEALLKILRKNDELLRIEEGKEKARVAKAREYVDQEFVDDEFVGPTTGRVGLVSPETRSTVRGQVAEMGGIEQFATEASPSIGGAMIGGTLGAFPPLAAATGGLSIAGGAALGSILGEVFGQETGISPKSDAALILSGAPGMGPALGATARLGRRKLSALLKNVPAVKAASSHITAQRAAGELESMGATIIGNKRGLSTENADFLYGFSKTFAGAEMPIENLSGMFKRLDAQVELYREFPGMEEAAKTLEKTVTKIRANKSQSVGMDDVMVLYKATNQFANVAERTAGVTNKISEDTFKLFDEEISKIANAGTKRGEAAAYVQMAFKRSQLDRAVQTFERGAAQHMSQPKGSTDVLLDVHGFRSWLFNKTNPKHADFDRTLAAELTDELPEIKHKLNLWSKITEDGLNPAGPNSLVIRNIGARTGAGVVGYLIGGPVGAGIGAAIGSKLPEGIVSILLHPKARTLVDASLRMGHGTISQERWALAAAATTQGIGRGVVGVENIDMVANEMQNMLGSEGE